MINGRTLFSELQSNKIGYQAILDSIQTLGLLEQAEDDLVENSDRLRLKQILRLKTRRKIDTDTNKLNL